MYVFLPWRLSCPYVYVNSVLMAYPLLTLTFSNALQGSVEFAVRTEQIAHEWRDALERVIANAKPSATAHMDDTHDELCM